MIIYSIVGYSLVGFFSLGIAYPLIEQDVIDKSITLLEGVVAAAGFFLFWPIIIIVVKTTTMR